MVHPYALGLLLLLLAGCAPASVLTGRAATGQKSSIRIVAPATRAIIDKNTPVAVELVISDTANVISQLEFVVDGRARYRVPTAALAQGLAPLQEDSIGSHVLQARAYDATGVLVADSDVVIVIVSDPPVATADPPSPSAPVATPEMTAVQRSDVLPGATPGTPMLVVSAEVANLRSGPGQVYTLIGALKRGDQARILGKGPDGQWWQIERLEIPAKVAWVFGSLVTVAESQSSVPVVAPPVVPTTRFVATQAPKPGPTAAPTAIQPTPTPNPDDGCNPSNPDWRGQGRGNPEYAFCVRQDLNFRGGSSGGHLELRWDIYGVSSIELRFDGGQRGLREHVAPQGAYGFYRGEFPGCNKAELYITRKDDKVVGYNELSWCS